jgi:hypothetical protein
VNHGFELWVINSTHSMERRRLVSPAGFNRVLPKRRDDVFELQPIANSIRPFCGI